MADFKRFTVELRHIDCDCWWALFGDRAAENRGEETAYTKHQELEQASATSKTLVASRH